MRNDTGPTSTITTPSQEEAWAIANVLINEQIDYRVEASAERWKFHFVEAELGPKALDFLASLDGIEGF